MQSSGTKFSLVADVSQPGSITRAGRRIPNNLLNPLPHKSTDIPLSFTIHKECYRTLHRHNMSFDRLSSLESQPTTTRRQDDNNYRDDPEFSRLAETLSTRLFELTTNISRLSNQIALLGTKRDTERVRERVQDLLEETRDGFKEVGEGVKKVSSWEDVNVCLRAIKMFQNRF